MEFAGYIWDVGVIAALLASAVSFYAAQKAKQSADSANRISERTVAASVELERIKFREKWIQNLRNEMTETVALIHAEGKRTRDEKKSLDKHYVKMLLLMNPKDENYERLRELTLSLNEDDPEIDGQSIEDPLSEFISLCQTILKKEWRRLNQEIDEYKAL